VGLGLGLVCGLVCLVWFFVVGVLFLLWFFCGLVVCGCGVWVCFFFFFFWLVFFFFFFFFFKGEKSIFFPSFRGLSSFDIC